MQLNKVTGTSTNGTTWSTFATLCLDNAYIENILSKLCVK